MKRYTWDDVAALVMSMDIPQNAKVWGVPRGGSVVAGLLHLLRGVELVSSPTDATAIVDDLVDSGETRQRYTSRFPHALFVVLVEKTSNEWLVFPWEKDDDAVDDESIASAMRTLGRFVRENPASCSSVLAKIAKGYP